MVCEGSAVKRLPLHKRVLFRLLAVVLSILATAILVEGAYRLHDAVKPRPLRRATKRLDYTDTWRTGGLGPGGLLREGFDGEVFDGYGGTVRWVNNDQGFRSTRSFSVRPPPGALRVLSLGDSFTAGYRVGQGATYSDWIERELGQGDIEVLISCVESPHRGLEYLERFGVGWRPHLVLLGVTLGNDIAQDYVSLHPEPIGFHHGLESFLLPASSLRADPRPRGGDLASFLRRHSWLWADAFPADRPIAASYRDSGLRLFDPWHGLGLFLGEPPPIVEEAYQRHFAVLRSMASLCEARGITFAVLLFPQRFQVQSNDWWATVEAWGLDPTAFDLRAPNRRIRAFCAEHGIAVIDPVEHMARVHERSRISAYLPQGDMHWNARGHRVWFEGARADLARRLAAARQALVRPAREG